MNATEKFCSVGLLSFAVNGDVNGNIGECGKVLADIIRANYPERTNGVDSEAQTIIRFNDHHDTTFEDVERVFEKAEVAWDERI